MSRQVIPKEVDEAIWALYNRPRAERPIVREILRRFANDECGIGFPIDLKERTYYEHLARLKVKREPDHSTGEPAAILATADAIRAEIVGLARREVRDIKREKKVSGVLRVPTVRRLAAIEKMLADIERREGKKARSKPSVSPGAEASRDSTRGRLSRLVEHEEREPASPSPPTPNGDNATSANVSAATGTEVEIDGSSDFHEHAPTSLARA